MQHYTYIHRRGDSGEIFYIGKGQKNRVFDKKGRNRHWHSVVNKHGHTVEIVAWFETDDEAKAHEIKLIAEHRASGAKLVNKTDGGEGTSGFKWSEDQRKQFSEKKSAPELLFGYTERAKKQWLNPAYRDHMTSCSQRRWADPEAHIHMSQQTKIRANLPENRLRVKHQTEERWKDLSFRTRVVKSIRESANAPESKARVSAMWKGTVWITDGVTSRRIYPTDPLPPGFRYGRGKLK